ncbi:MAG: diguanylate cyclase [Candidatus Thiodiazotropha sp.]
MGERELVVTTSIGIAIYPSDGVTPMELLRNSDIAMYHSKGQGRSTFNLFTTEMNLTVSRMLEVEEQLHGALEQSRLGDDLPR